VGIRESEIQSGVGRGYSACDVVWAAKAVTQSLRCEILRPGNSARRSIGAWLLSTPVTRRISTSHSGPLQFPGSEGKWSEVSIRLKRYACANRKRFLAMETGEGGCSGVRRDTGVDPGSSECQTFS